MSTATDVAHPLWETQRSFDELGRPLRDVTFTVVDLETTGASVKAGSRITEIGAVKVRGGEVLGEFQTLVNPHAEIPAFIAVLTGITNSMVAASPPIEAALPSFLEFARGTVLVAHNAPFDVGFLQHYADELGHPWPGFEVLDTAKLARRVVTRDETPNCKLGSLAVLFGASTTPNHRALADARATVDVLHGLMERLGGQGVQTLEELQTYSSRVDPRQRRKRHLAEHLPVLLGSTSSATTNRGCSTSAPRATCAVGCAPTSPRPRRVRAWVRWSGWLPRSMPWSAPPRSRHACVSCD